MNEKKQTSKIYWEGAVLFLIALIPLFTLLAFNRERVVNPAPWFSFFLIILAYASYLGAVAFSFIRLDKFTVNYLPLGIIYFLSFSLIIIIFFSLLFNFRGQIITTNDSVLEIGTSVKYFYFSCTTFTTLGYGDFAPLDSATRLMCISEAMLGVTHMVTFFSLFAAKLKH